ncbi:hypothetical protein ACXYMU_05860 [Pontibacter sp. CAU 1760]
MKKLYLLPVALFFFFVSCNDEDGTPIPNPIETEATCMVLEETMSSLSGLNDRTATVEYDAEGRIASVTYTNRHGAGLVDRYERNSDGKISKVQTFNGANVTWEMDVEYNSKGDVIRGTTSENGGMVTQVIQLEYEYDPQGNITKTTRTVVRNGRGEGSRVKTYEYTNGNLTKMVITSGNSVNHYVYEYDLDKPAFPLEFDNLFSITWDRGTPSKNLVKRYTITHPNNEDSKDIVDFTYKLNEAGMPTRTTSTSVAYIGEAVYNHAADSLVTTRSYKCE